jgi:putative toxin-antitoxin system antitoxin component (TIGR02293 family)
MSSTLAKGRSAAGSRGGMTSSLLAKPTAAGAGRGATTSGRAADVVVQQRGGKVTFISYKRSKGVDAYVRAVFGATPMEIVEIERQGVEGTFIKDLSKRMDLATSRIFAILGVPKATAEKKAAAGELVTGRGGQAAVGMIKLLGIAQEIVENSTSPDAKDFDAAKWLGQWIERPQPSLGGRKPADLIDTPTGVEMVARVLGSVESGAYQ